MYENVAEWASIVCVSPFCDKKSISDDGGAHLHYTVRMHGDEAGLHNG